MQRFKQYKISRPFKLRILPFTGDIGNVLSPTVLRALHLSVAHSLQFYRIVSTLTSVLSLKMICVQVTYSTLLHVLQFPTSRLLLPLFVYTWTYRNRKWWGKEDILFVAPVHPRPKGLQLLLSLLKKIIIKSSMTQYY